MRESGFETKNYPPMGIDPKYSGKIESASLLQEAINDMATFEEIVSQTEHK